MNVLITGGAGFIGSHLAERLVRRGDRVTVIDDLSTGSLENLAHLESEAGLRVVIASVTDAAPLADLVDEADVIFHLAAAVGVRLVVESPIRAMETNLRGTEMVLELAARRRRRLLLASTSEVYGRRTQVPFREDEDLVLGPPDKGRWSYACSKLMDEFLAVAYWREKRVPTVVARLFNVVGPRQTGRYGMVIPRLTRQALTGADITVHGSGLQQRCFTHVSDAVTALIGLADHADTAGEVYNVGSPQEIAIGDLAERVKALTASASRIIRVPYDVAYKEGFEDMMRRVPDLAKIERLIGWRAALDLDRILGDTIEHQRQRAVAEPRPAFLGAAG